MSNKPTVPLSQPLGRGTVGQCSERRDSERDRCGTTSLKTLAALALRRDSTRDRGGTEAGQNCPAGEKPVGQSMCGFSGDDQLIGNGPEATTASFPQPAVTPTLPKEGGGSVCCECGAAITAPVTASWGGQPCHRDCGEAAFEREKARRANCMTEPVLGSKLRFGSFGAPP
jgi:hypothetical protein